MKAKNEIGDYMSSYPELKKWINTCVCCGATGYKPEMPDKLTSRFGGEEITTCGAQNIRRFYPPLELNDNGLCAVCERLLAKNDVEFT